MRFIASDLSRLSRLNYKKNQESIASTSLTNKCSE